MQHPDPFFIKQKHICPLRRAQKKIYGEKHLNNNRVEIKATYVPSNYAGIVERKFQRILIVFSCGPDGGTLRTAAKRDDGVCKLNKKRLPRHMILDIQTQLPPPTVCTEGFF